MAITLTCLDSLRNFFSKAQHDLAKSFASIEGIRGVWEGKIRNGGMFPQGSGYAARTSRLGFNRPRHTQISWQPMVGLQDDCAVSCNTPTSRVNLGNADHTWYRVFTYGETTEPFCLKSMWSDAFNLPAQIRNHVMNLKMRTVEMMDEFYRANQVAISENKWVGVDDGTNNPKILRTLNGSPAWRFEQDANGTINVNKIILNAGIAPGDIGLLSVDVLGRIRDVGRRIGAFPRQGVVRVITDIDTKDYLPKYDTNVRADNRYRAPESLDPSFDSVQRYAGYDLEEDPFLLHYYWDTEDANYPAGVLTRIEHWSATAVSEGCWDDTNEDYLNADFALSIPFNNMVWMLQNMSYDNPPEMPYEQPHSPYNGVWKFFNEPNEITPCNSQRNLAYWQMVLEKAAKPDLQHFGHVVLHRRFNTKGVFKSCRTLQVPVGGSYDCGDDCPPFDHYPPALVNRTTCGLWNAAAISCGD